MHPNFDQYQYARYNKPSRLVDFEMDPIYFVAAVLLHLQVVLDKYVTKL